MNSKRHNALVSLLLAIIIGVGLAACSSPAKLPRLADDAVIVAFGDSLTFGTGAEPSGELSGGFGKNDWPAGG